MRNTSGFSVVKWLVALAIIGGGGYMGYRYFEKPAAAGFTYRTSTITRGDVVQTVIANGSLTPERLVQVGSQISGTITQIKADFNSHVKEGDVLAQLDPATYERALGQAQAQLANAQAARELAKLNDDRAKELFAGSLISKSDYDSARVNLMQAEANVKMQQANVDRAQVDLSRTTIYAPMDGVIISRKVEVGQTVAAGMNVPTLFIMADDLSHMQIEAAVSEADVGNLEEGQKVTFKVDAFMNRQFVGTVKQVRFEPTTNQNVVTYTTVVAVDNKDLKLRPGMTADATFITADRKGVVTIPNAALRFALPEGANVVKDPKAKEEAKPGEKPAVELATSGPFAGLPVQPWFKGGQFHRPTEEEQKAYEASLTPEQKEKYEKIRADMRARFAQRAGNGGGGGGRGFGGRGGGPGGGGFGGFGGGGGNGRRATPESPSSATVYLIDAKPGKDAADEDTPLRPVTVKLGISDGKNTEVLEGLKEGDVVAIGTATAVVAQAETSNPLNPFSRRRRR